MNPRNTVLRVAATSGVAAVLFGMAAAPAVAADGDVDVLNTETVQVYTSPTGEIETQRVYEQLILTGNGSVDLSNPISTDGLRNLDGFGGFDIEGRRAGHRDDRRRRGAPALRSATSTATCRSTCR